MVTYSLFLDDFVDDDNVIVLNEHEDLIQPSESSFDATDADGDTIMQDVHENLKTPSISDVGNDVLTKRPCSSVDVFMSPGSSMEDDESDADSATSLLGLEFGDEDELDADSLCMSPAGSSVGDESDADSATSLLGLEFVDEDDLDDDSLSMSPDSSVDEELEVEESVTPSVLFRDGSDNINENRREIGSFADVGVDVFITEDEDENRARWISLGCQTTQGLSLMFLLVLEQITLRVFVFGCLFMWLSSMMMPGKVGRPIPNPVVYLSCPVLISLRGKKLVAIEEDGDGEVDDEEEEEEHGRRWAPLVPLRGVKLATIEEEGGGDVDEEEPDSLHCPPLVPLLGMQRHAIEEEVDEEQPHEQVGQEENDDFGPSIYDDDEEEDQFEEATPTSARSEPAVPLLEFRRSARIAAKAGMKVILPVGIEGSVFVNGKRRSARLALS